MSLTTIDKQDIKVMISEGIQTSPIIHSMSSDIKNLDSKTERAIKNLDSKFDVSFDAINSKVDVLFEELDSKIDTVIEIVSNNSELKKQVKDHEYRLTDIEKVQPIIIKTLALHSKQLGEKI